jgi:PleD family two-component response regulator
MNILIVDRDQNAAEMLQNMLESQGHHVAHETVRKGAQERLNNEQFDIIFIDPAPLSSAREFAMPLRWEQHDDYFYLVLTGHDANDAEANVVRSGMNTYLVKPFHAPQVDRVLQNATRLIEFMRRLRTQKASLTDSQIFGQRGFYQLVLSALDRAYRYHEQAFLLVIRLNNIETLAAQAGPEVAANVLAELGKFLSRLHRLSDFLGHTGSDEYMLLILRPAVDTEPHDAVERFGTALHDFQEEMAQRVIPGFKLDLNLELWALPSAELLLQKN